MFSRQDGEKASRIRSAMEREGFDALVLKLTENITYATGYWPFLGLSYLLLPRDAEPTLVCPVDERPYAEKGWLGDVRAYAGETFESFGDAAGESRRLLREAASEKALAGGVIGFEGSMEVISASFLRHKHWGVGLPTYDFLRGTFPDSRLRDASSLLYTLRSDKTEREAEFMRLVNEVADMGCEAFYNNLKEGRRESEVAAAVEQAVTSRGIGHRGVERLVVFAFVMSGPRSAEAYKWFDVHTSKRLQRGEYAMLELNVCVEGYWSDLTRTYVVGSPTSEQRGLIELVLEAQQTAVESTKPGVSAAEINDLAYDVIRRGGQGGYIKHRLGHGIGNILHEPIPALHHASKDILKPGMVHSVEPGIYMPGVGGIRIEDDVLDTASGAEYLSKFNRGPA